MANIFSNWINQGFNSFARLVASYINDKMETGYKILGDYYTGDHRQQLVIREGQQNDNIIQNFIGLAVDRSVSRLYRGGVDFVLPDEAVQQQEYIDLVWKLNKKNILFYQLGLYGAVYGTAYVKIVLDAINNPLDSSEMTYPRLMPVYPRIIRMRTNPQDVDEVIEYIIEYAVDVDGREVAYKENTVKENNTWRVDNWQKQGTAAWELVSSVDWPYDFPPIVHWKNLPSLNNVYGDSEIDDVVNIQDKSNFAISNINKILKYHAQPPTVGTGFSASQIQKVDASPDSNFWAIPQADADVKALPPTADIKASMEVQLALRQSIFDVAREVDIQSIGDRLGQVTNFGLRVLYTDATDKNDTKRQLYGDALKEINRRLLVLDGKEGEASDPGSIQWGEALPVNVIEEMTADKMALEMGIVDKKTVAQKYADRWGVEWEQLEKQLDAEELKADTGIDLAPDDMNRRNLEQMYQGVMSNFMSSQRERVTNAGR